MKNIVAKFVILAQNRWLRKSRFITRILFGVRILPSRRIHWDFTTLALKKLLIKFARFDQKVLEIGTGPYALLSIFLYKRVPCQITATDINEDYVKQASTNAEYNKAKIKLICSDLFEHISGKYDLIFWNSVYIPKDTGIKLGISSLYKTETDWCGGSSGSEMIEKFLLGAKEYLKDNGRILLGFSQFYLDRKVILDICCNHSLILKEISSNLFNPSMVAVISRS
jgi:methylase of polypeptide subunit release factors